MGIDVETLCPWESGRQLLRLPEVEFLERIVENNQGIEAPKAKQFYDKLWGVLIDAQTKERKAKMKVNKLKRAPINYDSGESPVNSPEEETDKSVVIEIKMRGEQNPFDQSMVLLREAILETGLTCVEMPWFCSFSTAASDKYLVFRARVLEEELNSLSGAKRKEMLDKVQGKMCSPPF